MEFSEFSDSDNRLPPSETRIIELRAEPWPDGRRIRVHAQITPFAERPSIEVQIYNDAGEEVASATLIEVLTPRFVVTLHIREAKIQGRYMLSGRLYYPEIDSVDQATYPFEIQPVNGEEFG